MRHPRMLALLLAGSAAAAAAPLEAWNTGAYLELATCPNPDGYALLYVPALVSVLVAAEEQKGGALTEAEVLSLRDRAVVLAVPEVQAKALEQGRGYRDLDPARCWEEWQEQRHRFFKQ